jgi:hypothetical protein
MLLGAPCQGFSAQAGKGKGYVVRLACTQQAKAGQDHSAARLSLHSSQLQALQTLDFFMGDMQLVSPSCLHYDTLRLLLCRFDKKPYVRAGLMSAAGEVLKQWAVDVPWPVMAHGKATAAGASTTAVVQ